MKYITTTLLFFIVLKIYSQNCEGFKYDGDTLQYEACLIAENASIHYQFSKEYQQIYDESLEKCNYFSTAYHAKSVAYLKSGDFVTWKKLIDNAVVLKPKEYLGYRAWCRFEFFRDYEGAIKDIEKLDSMINYNIGYSSDGEYHLDIARAICYKKIGQREKAIQIIESKFSEKNYDPGIYDFFHLGVLYFEVGNYEQAKSALVKQIEFSESAESYYYLALVHKNLNNKSEYRSHLLTAKELYSLGTNMSGGYAAYVDKIYMKEIMQEMNMGL